MILIILNLLISLVLCEEMHHSMSTSSTDKSTIKQNATIANGVDLEYYVKQVFDSNGMNPKLELHGSCYVHHLFSPSDVNNGDKISCFIGLYNSMGKVDWMNLVYEWQGRDNQGKFSCIDGYSSTTGIDQFNQDSSNNCMTDN